MYTQRSNLCRLEEYYKIFSKENWNKRTNFSFNLIFLNVKYELLGFRMNFE